jgi:hypothetical protein
VSFKGEAYRQGPGRPRNRGTKLFMPSHQHGRVVDDCASSTEVGKPGGGFRTGFSWFVNQKIIHVPICRINNDSQFVLEVPACNSSLSCSMPGSTNTNTT